MDLYKSDGSGMYWITKLSQKSLNSPCKERRISMDNVLITRFTYHYDTSRDRFLRLGEHNYKSSTFDFELVSFHLLRDSFLGFCISYIFADPRICMNMHVFSCQRSKKLWCSLFSYISDLVEAIFFSEQFNLN